VAGEIAMDGASLGEWMNADALDVQGDLFMREVASAGRVNLIFMRVGGSLDIRGANLNFADLSGTSVRVDLRLGNPPNRPGAVAVKGQLGNLNLQNVRVTNLADTRSAWPEKGHLRLDGFTFAHIGGFEGDTGAEARNRGVDWWDGWARLDDKYSPAPYEQL